VSKVQRFCVVIAFAAAVVAIQAGAQHRAAPSAPTLTVIQPDLSLPLDRRMQRPAGLAWQPPSSGGERLRLTAAEAGKVFEVDPAAKGPPIEHAVAGSVAPGPAAFDVRRWRLWAVDQNREHPRPIRIFRRVSGGPSPDQPLRPFAKAKLPVISHRPTIRGIAIDSSRDPSRRGRIVWICRGGGLCSTIEVYDLKRGEMLAHFFPRCEPEAITIDPDGRRLWILANNGPQRSMVIIERWLTGDEPSPGPSVLETRRFLKLPPEIPRATAIAATRDAIWALVEDPRTSTTQPTVRVKLHRFSVGSFPVPPGED
jgi:hypothetical protein